MICLVNSDNERDSIILTRYLSAVEMLKLLACVLARLVCVGVLSGSGVSPDSLVLVLSRDQWLYLLNRTICV